MDGLSGVSDPEGRQETPEGNYRSLKCCWNDGEVMDTVSARDLKESPFLETMLSEGGSSGGRGRTEEASRVPSAGGSSFLLGQQGRDRGSEVVDAAQGRLLVADGEATSSFTWARTVLGRG